MIGGMDVWLPTRGEPSVAMLACVRLLRRYWPELICALPDGRKLSEAGTDFSGESELLVYRDEAAARSWDGDLGPQNSMLYLIRGDEGVTVVLDDADSARDVVDSLRTLLFNLL